MRRIFPDGTGESGTADYKKHNKERFLYITNELR
jgi:hypothetical protein